MNFITPSKSPKIRVFNYYPTPISQHMLPAGRQFVFTASVASGAGDGKRRCYVKNITSYVKNITSYVKIFT